MPQPIPLIYKVRQRKNSPSEKEFHMYASPALSRGIIGGSKNKNSDTLNLLMPFFENSKNMPLNGREAIHTVGAVIYTGRFVMSERICHIIKE